MSRIKLLVLFMFGLQLRMCAAQELKQEHRAIKDLIVKNYAGLQDGFALLQSQDKIDQSFDDYLANVLLWPSENQKFDLDAIVSRAENFIALHMKDRFLSILESLMESKNTLNLCHDPVFLYVMQHKDGYMYDMVREWFDEWSVTPDNLLSTWLEVKFNPLVMAAMQDHSEIAQLLIAVGADVNIKCSYGNTVLHAAAFNNSKKVTKILIAAGANLTIQNDLGLTAEQFFCTPEMRDIFRQARQKITMSLPENKIKKD